MITANKLLLGTGAKDTSNGYVEFVSSTPMTITPKYTNSGVTLQYSLDGSTWTTIATDATTPSANIIYFRGCATGTKSLYTASANTNAWTFTGSTNLECNGKLDRLIQNTLGGDDNILTIGNYCFAYIFYNGTSLIKVDDDFLPATTLANSCYQSMFLGCKGLTVAPVLPATTLQSSCYQSMFQGCTNLTTAPALPAITLATSCYYSMFNGCRGLTTAPALPATTLATYCYYSMFLGCTGLTTAPALPATTLATNCYRDMFRSCTSLTVAPVLPATNLVGYCYQSMFYGCTKITTSPVLPATTLANYCYNNMFRGCTNLTTAPVLPATILSDSCYRDMFNGCTKIKLSTTLTGIYDTAYRIPTTGTGITATDALASMFTATGGTFIGTPEINTTYYTENTPA